MKYLLLVLVGVIAGSLIGAAFKFFKKYKSAEARATLAEKEKAIVEVMLAKLKKNVALDTSDLLQLNTIGYDYPTFDSRFTNVVIFSPMGCFVGKKTAELYMQLASAGYYQQPCRIPIDDSNFPPRDMPYDPATGNAVDAKKFERWQALEKTAKDAESSARVAYNELQPAFHKNAETHSYVN